MVLNEAPGADPSEGLMSLSLEFRSIDHAPPKQKPMPELPKAVRAEASMSLSQGDLPQLPAVDLSKLPEHGTPIELVPMVHERNGWPCHAVFDRTSWALHLLHLETHNRKAGMRVIIAKAETHGPKTTPYTIYVMHIKTAFSVRGISRFVCSHARTHARTHERTHAWVAAGPPFFPQRPPSRVCFLSLALALACALLLPSSRSHARSLARSLSLHCSPAPSLSRSNPPSLWPSLPSSRPLFKPPPPLLFRDVDADADADAEARGQSTNKEDADRRYSEFKDLDEALRAVKRSAPTLPRKKTWGKMSPKFITERKRQLQAYVEAILSDPACANSEPFRNFLGTHGHPIEQEILKRYSSGMQGLASDGNNTALLTPWRLATGTTAEAIEALVQRCRAARDVRQEARALNQLGIMECESGQRAQALDAMRRAFLCCRQLDDAHGLLSCALSWASIHAHFGEYDVAEQRLREAEGMAAEMGAISGQASCHLLLSLIRSAQGRTAQAAKEAVLAAELFTNAGDVGHTALAQFTLGSLLLRCAEVRQAVEVLESSLLLRRRARDTLGLGESLCLLGQAFAQIGYQLHAMDYFDQALALCHELGNRPGIYA